MTPYAREKLEQAIEVARVAADMLMGGYGDAGLEEGRTAVFRRDVDALKVALDRLSPHWFDDTIEERQPFRRVLDAVDVEEAG